MTPLDERAVIGGLILLAMTLKRDTQGVAWGDGWHWPVPDFIAPDGTRYPATVSQEFKPSSHRGVDIMFRRTSPTDRADYPAGELVGGVRNATTLHFAPPGTPILAARDARVWSVVRLPTGLGIVLDHGKPWATFYAHLDSTPLPPHASGALIGGGPAHVVKAGDLIGTMGANPNTDPTRGAVDGQRLRHLHFEAWYKGGASNAAVDPELAMRQWGRSTWRP